MSVYLEAKVVGVFHRTFFGLCTRTTNKSAGGGVGKSVPIHQWSAMSVYWKAKVVGVFHHMDCVPTVRVTITGASDLLLLVWKSAVMLVKEFLESHC